MGRSWLQESPFLSSLLSQSWCPAWLSAQQSCIQEHKNHWTCSPAGLFIISSGAARQKAKWSPVSKSKSLKIPPENQEHTPQTEARDHCRHRQGNFALWTSLHPSTTLASTFIRKAKWGIIMPPPQRRTALERQQLLPAQRDLSRKAGGCCKGRVANSLGNTKKVTRNTPSPALKISSSSTRLLPANPDFVVEAAPAPLRSS